MRTFISYSYLFIFHGLERTFRGLERIFHGLERTFRLAEYKTDPAVWINTLGL